MTGRHVFLKAATYREGGVVAVVVAAWMSAGWLLHLGTEAYLVLGVPIVAVYQLAWRRMPLHALWRFDGGPLAFGRVGTGVAVCAAVLPLWQLASLAVQHATTAPTAAWFACSALGALGTGWAFAEWRRAPAWRDGLQLVPAIGVIIAGVLVFTLDGLQTHRHLPPAWNGRTWSAFRSARRCS